MLDSGFKFGGISSRYSMFSFPIFRLRLSFNFLSFFGSCVLMCFVGLSPSLMSITYGVFKLVILGRDSWESRGFLPKY